MDTSLRTSILGQHQRNECIAKMISRYDGLNGSSGNHIPLNTTSLPPSTVPEPPIYLVITLSLLYTLIFLVGTAGNILVTAVVLHGRTLHTSVNYFLVNLSIADLFVLIVCMPTAWVDVYAQDVWYFGEAMCKLVPYLENVVAGASVFTILFISIERYKAICQPLHKNNKAVCRVLKIVIVIWITCALASLPFIFLPVYRDSVWMDGTPIKVCRHPMRYSWQKVYLLTVPVIFFLLPFLIILALYFRVGRILIPKLSSTCDMYDESYREKLRQRRQGINIVILIVLVFFASHLPYRIICLWHIFEDQDVIVNLGLENYLTIIYSVRIAFYLNHALNPILYNFVSKKFRTELRWICHTYRYRVPKCLSREKACTGKGYRGSYPPTVKFKKVDNGSVAKIQTVKPGDNKSSSSSSSEHRKFRNDFSVLYASVHAEKSQRNGNTTDGTRDIREHFCGQINCVGDNKRITSFRVFIRSTSEGFAIDLDLQAKGAKALAKKNTTGTYKTTCL